MMVIPSYNAPCVVLGKERLWWVFLLSSICSPFILASLVGGLRLVLYLRKEEHRKRMVAVLWADRAKSIKAVPSHKGPTLEEMRRTAALRSAADRLVSDHYLSGRILSGLAFLFSMCSLMIYYSSVSHRIRDVEWCRAWLANAPQQVDFAFNCFFLLYYVLRFLAADDKVTFIFNLYSVIDYFTVPPAFVGLMLDRDWIGLKFLRVLYLRRLPALLAAIGLIFSPAKIKLMQLALTWIAILLAAGGLFHLVENSGDPFYQAFDGQRVSYWDFCYFAFGTMATLGSADVYVKTVLGKMTNCCLVIVVLAVIALALPDVARLVGSRRKYSGEYRSVHNEKHVVICGYVTHATIVAIFNEFFHPDRNIEGIKLICLEPTEPNMEFARFIKMNRFQIGYLQGDVLVPGDCSRAKVHEADAVLILADIPTSNAEAEDGNNIMRVVAVKNYHPKTRIIVQLLQYRSKSYLTSIPNWDPQVGDNVVCLPEIKLGLLAQSCVAPGFSTLMGNLFASRSSDTSDENPVWMNEYVTGAGKEMYTSRMSRAFEGLSFEAAAEVCYLKLDILLIAMAKPPVEGASFFSLQFILNPPDFIVTNGTCGCFLADSAQQAERFAQYLISISGRDHLRYTVSVVLQGMALLSKVS
ncbi:hypothetical protein RvY_03484-2 [Ramazzottius varieornatus]|uniref:BK channel n=1 Tax=Ramazzottius varieornatus TaxID=947166 RepID=A0A1D1UVA1_RAMVA|nr:hypothetical protein RvY_03484-2 [Ramazzottius varieornatus]